MKIFLIPLLLVSTITIITGCTPLQPSQCHKTTALGDCFSGRFTDHDKYGAQASAIKESIESKLEDRHAWKGKKCRLHLDFAYDGKLKNIETREGNKEYCAALKAAAWRAVFPPFPDAKIYDVFSGSRFDMEGE